MAVLDDIRDGKGLKPITSTGTSTTGTSGCYPTINNCIYRLPCGLCTYLRTLCPLGNVGTVGINWNEVTCQTDKEGE